ncbi:DUF4062 domain-containing protein [Acetobacterium tundrae]|uniref:DUF4062 domain-containing protein n=1 Tax=Acetobacterium tundrae TaxID=132932 RepID=A0ABR6WIQ1_9FIRM|nr:DUF4062 domain-containing protein [Acetobacterium tundrae]
MECDLLFFCNFKIYLEETFILILKSGLGRTPTVFVSSTCYDLKQIRTNIMTFIENKLGYEALLSEYDSFPIDPNLGTVENCLHVVQERADIFVLIVGGRYGNVTDCGKSVTNLEYLKAKSKGIPIYAFIEKSILSIFPLWKDNKLLNFDSVVDSSKLFEFIEKLNAEDNIWLISFENSKDIELSLQRQLGFLLNDCLKVRNQILKTNTTKYLNTISAEALKIIIDKSIGWEYKLFGQQLLDGLEKLTKLRRDLKYGISFSNFTKFDEIVEIFDWVELKNNEVLKKVSYLNAIVYDAMPEAFGEPGVSGDIEHIIYVADKLMDVFESIIQGALEYKSVIVPEEWNNLLEIELKISETIISDIETFIDLFNKEVFKIPIEINDQDKPLDLNVILTLTKPDLKPFEQEFERLKKIMGINYIPLNE